MVRYQLLQAIRDNDIDEIARLIENGEPVNTQLYAGSTPLHGAGSMKVVTLLIQSGADVNAADEAGWTPLHVAAFYGRVRIFKFLIGAGADYNLKTVDGRLPEDLTQSEKIKTICKKCIEKSDEKVD